MILIDATSVDDALAQGLDLLAVHGVESPSRNGKVLVAPEAVTTTYYNPTKRVCFWEARDANPFFHLMEALWMLAGRNDVKFVAQFNRQMLKYSDDGVTLAGAYGFRWRFHFGLDQIAHVIKLLRDDPTTRRAVIGMYDPMTDAHGKSDIPCNTTIYFAVRGERLDMTVCCRSNDIVWGAYGANAVHFSVLHELVASCAGFPMGRYEQISNNFHIYEPHWPLMARTKYTTDYQGPVIPLVEEGTGYFTFQDDLQLFLTKPLQVYYPRSSFLMNVARPMWQAWVERKSGEGNGLGILAKAEDSDWVRAGIQWITRRESKRERSE